MCFLVPCAYFVHAFCSFFSAVVSVFFVSAYFFHLFVSFVSLPSNDVLCWHIFFSVPFCLTPSPLLLSTRARKDFTRKRGWGGGGGALQYTLTMLAWQPVQARWSGVRRLLSLVMIFAPLASKSWITSRCPRRVAQLNMVYGCTRGGVFFQVEGKGRSVCLASDHGRISREDSKSRQVFTSNSTSQSNNSTYAFRVTMPANQKS